MMIFAGMDVSDKTTHLCVVDGDGALVRRDVVASDPEVLARWLKRHCGGLVRVVLETPTRTRLNPIMKARTSKAPTPSEDLEDNRW